MVLEHVLYFLTWISRSLSGLKVNSEFSITGKMMVPDLSGLANATESTKTAAGHSAMANITTAPTEPTGEAPMPQLNTTELLKLAREFGKPLNVSQDAAKLREAAKAAVKELQERQTCPSGTTYYNCAVNGFKGCCSVDPCNPGGGCPDGQTTSATSTASPQTTSSQTVTTSSTTAGSSTSSSASTSSTSDGKSSTTSLITASSSGTATSTSSTSGSSASAIQAPSCPGGNVTTFNDSSNIAYNIHCNADNSYSSESTIQVGTGGYSECFSACSGSSSCAGFTYVGLDSGDCYLKQKMPQSDYVAKNGSNYISCAKLNATAVAPLPKATSSSAPAAKKGSAGAIAGGVIGGVAFLALVLVLIALIAKRRRKKIEERRATVTHVIHGPIETQETKPGGGHARSGSTAHDAFAPFGGFYRGYSSAAADRQAYEDGEKTREESRMVPDRPPPSLPPGVRAEKGLEMLPATVYQRPFNRSADAVAMLDGTPIRRPISQSSGSRSSIFREHISEMEDTSFTSPPNPATSNRNPRSPDSDSPTLGREYHVNGADASLADDVRRKQHLMSWNNYNAGRQGTSQEELAATMAPRSPPSARSPEQVSPDLSNTPRDSGFVVSPMGSLDRGASMR